MVNIAVFVSGGGTNLQALIDAQSRGEFPGGRLALVVASNSRAYALERAKSAGIPFAVINKRECGSRFDDVLFDLLQKYDIGLVVLAGYLSILSERFVKQYERKILNIHPSLIPSFCGDGCYGLKVHELALERGVKVTGATVHFVNEITDGGEIVMQKAVEVLPGDTPESLQSRVMVQAEWVILPEAVRLFCEAKL